MKTCAFCNIPMTPLFRTRDVNRKVSPEVFAYVRCPSCGLISLAAVPADLGKYYAEAYYQIPSMDKLRKIAAAEHFKIDMVRAFKTSGALLEIGPAFGVFAYQAKQAGFEVDVIEMDKNCCDFLTREVGVHAVNSDDPACAAAAMKKHDVIALWHVFEHLVSPRECLDALVDNLAPGGILLIAVPNPEAWQFKLMGALWPHVDAPRHVHLVPKSVLESYLNERGLDLVMMTTIDAGGRSWNRFGWQRLLMNLFPGKWMQRACFMVGTLVSIPMSLWEQRGLKGAAYTVIFQKKVSL